MAGAVEVMVKCCAICTFGDGERSTSRTSDPTMTRTAWDKPLFQAAPMNVNPARGTIRQTAGIRRKKMSGRVLLLHSLHPFEIAHQRIMIGRGNAVVYAAAERLPLPAAQQMVNADVDGVTVK